MIVFISAKVEEARIAHKHLEKVDSGPSAMFSDDDINFNLELERFGVNTTELVQSVKHVFCAWVEDWEEEDRRILAKYKNLVFHDPDTGGSFTVWDKNMGFRHGRGYRWMLLSTCVDNDVDDEAFALDIVCELIANTPQEAGIDVVQQEE